MTDSDNGGRLMVAVREGTGEKLKKTVEGEKVVTLDELKPLLDHWIEATIKESVEYIKSR